MISVSQKFLELMQSNIRPKIEPTITVKGQDGEGNQCVLTWKTRNIHFGERILFHKSGFVIGAYDEGYRTISNPISESD